MASQSLRRPRHLLKASKYSLGVGEKTLLMGIMNLTPDSFSQDGRLSKKYTPADNVRFAKQLIAQGADILDLGAESSRPGAPVISPEEETRRLLPTLNKLVKAVRVPVSVDTTKSQVAQAALDQGASIINNIKGTQLDFSLLKMVRDYNAAIVLMHMRGNPRTMQTQTSYTNFWKEIIKELGCSIEKCLEIGIKKHKIIIDPGIGFAKTLAQNLEIIRNLRELYVLGCPVLIGPSRKSFIGGVLNKEVQGRLMGTAAAVGAGIMSGAHIIRVHDVKAMKDVALMTDAIINHQGR